MNTKMAADRCVTQSWMIKKQIRFRCSLLTNLSKFAFSWLLLFYIQLKRQSQSHFYLLINKRLIAWLLRQQFPQPLRCISVTNSEISIQCNNLKKLTKSKSRDSVYRTAVPFFYSWNSSELIMKKSHDSLLMNHVIPVLQLFQQRTQVAEF